MFIAKCAWTMREFQIFTGTFMTFLCLNASEQIVKYSDKPFIQEKSDIMSSNVQFETIFRPKQRDFSENVPDTSYLD